MAKKGDHDVRHGHIVVRVLQQLESVLGSLNTNETHLNVFLVFGRVINLN